MKRMKKIKRISILLCSLLGLTGCGSLSLVEGLVIGSASLAVSKQIETEQIAEIERINYYYKVNYDEKKTD